MERKDFLFDGGGHFYYDDALFPPGTDSFALGYFARPKAGDAVCDLGSGTGLLGTLLLARESALTLHCVELNAAATALAEKTFCENGWAERVRFHVGDLRDSAVLPKAGSIDFCISNPPYFKSGSGLSCVDEARKTAREESECTLDDVCAAAARVLRWGGKFCLVHRVDRLCDLICSLRAHALEPKRVRFVLPRSDAAPSLLLLEARRGGKSGLTVEAPLVIGSEEWDKVYFR